MTGRDKPASSPQRKEMVAAMSSGWPTRCTGNLGGGGAMKSSKETPIRSAVDLVIRSR